VLAERQLRHREVGLNEAEGKALARRTEIALQVKGDSAGIVELFDPRWQGRT